MLHDGLTSSKSARLLPQRAPRNEISHPGRVRARDSMNSPGHRRAQWRRSQKRTRQGVAMTSTEPSGSRARVRPKAGSGESDSSEGSEGSADAADPGKSGRS